MPYSLFTLFDKEACGTYMEFAADMANLAITVARTTIKTTFPLKNLVHSEIIAIFADGLVIMSRKEIVDQISQAIRRVAPTATAILYGSEARGDARPDSDIDVLILLDGDYMSLKREMDVTGPLNEIEWQTGVLVSPTVMLRKQWENMPFKTPFYINVMNEGIRI